MDIWNKRKESKQLITFFRIFKNELTIWPELFILDCIGLWIEKNTTNKIAGHLTLDAVKLWILLDSQPDYLNKGVSVMASKPNIKKRRHKQQSITRKIIIKMSILIVVLFGLSVIISALLSSRSLKSVTNEKLVLTAYESAHTLSNNIEISYSQTLGFAGSLRNISALPPAFQRQANAKNGFSYERYSEHFSRDRKDH